MIVALSAKSILSMSGQFQLQHLRPMHQFDGSKLVLTSPLRRCRLQPDAGMMMMMMSTCSYAGKFMSCGSTDAQLSNIRWPEDNLRRVIQRVEMVDETLARYACWISSQAGHNSVEMPSAVFKLRVGDGHRSGALLRRQP